MIYIGETIKGDKKNIFLICFRDEAELKQLIRENNSTNDSNEDIIVSNENTTPSSENHIEDSDKYTNVQKSNNDNNDSHSNNILQSECADDEEYENVKANKQIRTESDVNLKHNFKSEIAENNKELDVVCCDDVPKKHANENVQLNTWDDYDCYKISHEDFFPSKVIDLNMQKLIVTRFLNFYVGGKIPKGLRASDLVFAVISIMPLTAETENFIWPENEYSDSGYLFFITPEDKLSTEFKAITKKGNKSHTNTFKDNNSKVIKSSASTNKFGESENNTDASTCDNEITSSKFFEQNEDMGSTNIDSKNTTLDVDHKDVASSYITDLIADKTINWCGSTVISQPLQNSFKQYGPTENSAFISSCNKLLLAWEDSVESRVILKYFFGIISLTLMRGIVKGKKNIMNTFKSENFLNKIRFICYKITYSPPHESCVEKCCRELKLSEWHHKVMFAKIIFNSIRIDCMQQKSLMTPIYGLYNIFKMCVINHVAYFDMGIINLLKSIYGYVGPGTEFSIILEKLKSEEINHSMEQIRNFILKYMKNEKCRTYHWARYFDSKQFEYLSCNTSYATAVVLAVFVEKMTLKSDVWRSGWVRTRQDDLDKYKQLAEQLYEEYKRLCRARQILFQNYLTKIL